MKKRPGRIVTLVVCMLLAQHLSFSQKLMPELEHSLSLVQESWAILDKTRSVLWPEWDNYKQIAYFTAVLKKQDLLINPALDPKSNFKLFKTKLSPTNVYLREPGETEKIWGGAYRYQIDGKRYRGAQFRPCSEDYLKAAYRSFSRSYSTQDSIYFRDLYYSDNFCKSIIIHEAFHTWQFNIVMKKLLNEKHESSFSPNEKYQLLANKEGEILSEAFLCNDAGKLKELSKKFLQVRKERRAFLTDGDIRWEKRGEFVEGCATYIDTKVFELIDPKYWEVLKKARYLQIKESPKMNEDEGHAIKRCYYLGLAQAYILDKLTGNEWKRKIMNEDVYLEDLVMEAIKFD